MSRGGARQHGVNLIELLIAIVIISIVSSGVLLIYAQAVRYSADPMIQQQAVAIGEAYLDEILARPVADPAGGETGAAEGGEARATYDDVQDYAGLGDSPPVGQDGTAADLDADGQPDLAGYRVDVSVLLNQTLDTVAMTRVDVRVRYDPVIDLTLTGYKAGP